jgi:hypothetical protein
MKNCDTLPLYLVVHVFSDLFSPRLRFASFVRVVFLGRAVLYARDYYSVSSEFRVHRFCVTQSRLNCPR